MSNIYDMPKIAFKPSKEQFRENLLAIHVAIDPKTRADNSNALAKRLGLPQRTIYGVLKGETDPYESLDQIATALRLHPWQLLYPISDKSMLRLLRAYNGASDEGRRIIEIAVKGVEAENAENKPHREGSSATP